MVGAPGSGKTAAALTLTTKTPIDNIFVYAKHAHGPQYTELREIYEGMSPPVPGRWGTGYADIVPVEKLKKVNRSITLFDDLQGDNRGPGGKELLKYFTENRHGGTMTIYCGQNVIKIPKDVRENATHWMLFGGIPIDRLRVVYDLVASDDMPFAEFVRLYKECTHQWRENHGFLYIDKDSIESQYLPFKYRHKFDGAFNGMIDHNAKLTTKQPRESISEVVTHRSPARSASPDIEPPRVRAKPSKNQRKRIESPDRWSRDY
jgi:hypothetical protein